MNFSLDSGKLKNQSCLPRKSSLLKRNSSNHKYLAEKSRYSVSLPRKHDTPSLGSSRQQAIQRFRSNEASIIRKNTYEPFQSVVQEYFDLGHAELVPATSLASDKENFYLPMHAVTKSSSTSTKLRVIFDTSARSSNGYSFNDTLLLFIRN